MHRESSGLQNTSGDFRRLKEKNMRTIYRDEAEQKPPNVHPSGQVESYFVRENVAKIFFLLRHEDCDAHLDT